MHIVSPQRRTYRLIRHDGVFWNYAKIDDALFDLKDGSHNWFEVYQILGDEFQTTYDRDLRPQRDGFIIVDDLGDTLSKSDLNAHIYRIRSASFKKQIDHRSVFRDGAWPGIRRKTHHRGSTYRLVQTSNERAWRHAYDDDLIEAGVDPQSVGRSRYIPTARDGLDRYSEKSWKSHRPHQWR